MWPFKKKRNIRQRDINQLILDCAEYGQSAGPRRPRSAARSEAPEATGAKISVRIRHAMNSRRSFDYALLLGELGIKN